MNRVLSAAVACLLPLLCSAECLGPTPVAAASVVYHQHYNFQNESGDAAYQAPRLFEALKAEYECKVSRGEICAFDHDVWTDAQDGEAVGRPGFHVVRQAPKTAQVRVTFAFKADDVSPLQSRSVELFFERASPKSCWLLADLRSQRTPVLKTLEDFLVPEGLLRAR